MNKVMIGLGLSLIVIAGLVGYLVAPKNLGAVAYDATYLNTLNVSGKTTISKCLVGKTTAGVNVYVTFTATTTVASTTKPSDCN